MTSFESDGLACENVHMIPKPVQEPVPVWVSGTPQSRSRETPVRFGAAWVPWGDDAQNLGASIPGAEEW